MNGQKLRKQKWNAKIRYSNAQTFIAWDVCVNFPYFLFCLRGRLRGTKHVFFQWTLIYSEFRYNKIMHHLHWLRLCDLNFPSLRLFFLWLHILLYLPKFHGKKDHKNPPAMLLHKKRSWKVFYPIELELDKAIK